MNMITPDQKQTPFVGNNCAVYWHGGGWYAAPFAADGVSHYQRTGRQTLTEANAEAEDMEKDDGE